MSWAHRWSPGAYPKHPRAVFLYVFLPGPSECHIETSGIIEEADALVLIGPHTGQDDEVLLSALKSILTGYFHLLQRE